MSFARQREVNKLKIPPNADMDVQPAVKNALASTSTNIKSG